MALRLVLVFLLVLVLVLEVTGKSEDEDENEDEPFPRLHPLPIRPLTPVRSPWVLGYPTVPLLQPDHWNILWKLYRSRSCRREGAG